MREYEGEEGVEAGEKREQERGEQHLRLYAQGPQTLIDSQIGKEAARGRGGGEQ